jgi:hypothetical protein
VSLPAEGTERRPRLAAGGRRPPSAERSLRPVRDAVRRGASGSAVQGRPPRRPRPRRPSIRDSPATSALRIRSAKGRRLGAGSPRTGPSRR